MQSILAQLLAHSQALKEQQLVTITVRGHGRSGHSTDKGPEPWSHECLWRCMYLARVEGGRVLGQHGVWGWVMSPPTSASPAFRCLQA